MFIQNILHCIINHHRPLFSAKKNYKQYGNEKKTNSNKGVIHNDNEVTDEYRNTYEYNTYEDSIQQSAHQIKNNYDNQERIHEEPQ